MIYRAHKKTWSGFNDQDGGVHVPKEAILDFNHFNFWDNALLQNRSSISQGHPSRRLQFHFSDHFEQDRERDRRLRKHANDPFHIRERCIEQRLLRFWDLLWHDLWGGVNLLCLSGK
jgi:hypothetical protein